ncbi:MAG: helix-turn-helix transcriptional regulator [Prevotella sp.]|nr:helix-turn-helix transcriptional regulator [Prevotella sp.]
MKLFAQHGIRAVKMDDVASSLTISKRTLYELYDNKEFLLLEGMRFYHCQRREHIEQIVSECDNVMEIMLRLYKMKVDEFRQTNPAFYTDIKRYPSVLQYLKHENVKSRSKFLLFINRGISEGYFRPELNYELTGRLFDAMGRYFMENQLYRDYSIEDIFQSFIFISLRGLCTEKGITALDEML